jgi:hypothetical protein
MNVIIVPTAEPPPTTNPAVDAPAIDVTALPAAPKRRCSAH